LHSQPLPKYIPGHLFLVTQSLISLSPLFVSIMATAKTPEMVARENAAIQEALENVTSAAKAYAQVSSANAGNTGIVESGEVTQSRRSLYLKSKRLIQAVRGPADMVFCHQEHVRTYQATLQNVNIMKPHINRPLFSIGSAFGISSSTA